MSWENTSELGIAIGNVENLCLSHGRFISPSGIKEKKLSLVSDGNVRQHNHVETAAIPRSQHMHLHIQFTSCNMVQKNQKIHLSHMSHLDKHLVSFHYVQ